MSAPHRSEKISVYVNPNQLRRMASEMEKRMAECEPGQLVWSYDFSDLQGHKRERGIPDWDEMAVGRDAYERFRAIEDEADEFPQTYSGQSWRAAYRIWKVTKDNPALLDTDGWTDIPGVDLKDLDLTGFMYGWALNAVRQLCGRAPGPNPAIISVGAGDNQPIVPAMGPAGEDLKRVL